MDMLQASAVEYSTVFAVQIKGACKMIGTVNHCQADLEESWILATLQTKGFDMIPSKGLIYRHPSMLWDFFISIGPK